MELKVIEDGIEIPVELFVEPKKILQNMDFLKVMFPVLVDKISLLKLKKLDG